MGRTTRGDPKQRAFRAWTLRQTGKTLEEVGRELGVSYVTIHRDLKALDEAIARKQAQATPAAPPMLLERVEEMWGLVTQTKVAWIAALKASGPTAWADRDAAWSVLKALIDGTGSLLDLLKQDEAKRAAQELESGERTMPRTLAKKAAIQPYVDDLLKPHQRKQEKSGDKLTDSEKYLRRMGL